MKKKPFMAYAIILMGIIICSTVYADNTADFNEVDQINQKYEYAYTYTHFSELIECAASGNTYANAYVGTSFFGKGEYKLAYSHLLKCSGKYYGMCDHALGHMYEHGKGVLQNNQKAIKHYEMAAKLGRAMAAYDFGVFYHEMAVSLFNKQDKKSLDLFKSNAIKSYAWIKVSSAMGQKNYIKLPDDKVYPISDLIERYRKALIKKGYLEEAEELAIEICSKVTGCIQ